MPRGESGVEQVLRTEVERFDILKKKGGRGAAIYEIAVIRRDAKPLTTAGCWFSRWTKRSKMTKMHQTLDDLERERLKANHRLGQAS